MKPSQSQRGVKQITFKPVFQVKYNQNRKLEWYKVWIVARGFTQCEGIDYQEVFTLVANLKLVWLIIALAAKYNLELDQMDISTAYLNGELIEELYMLPLKGVSIQLGYCWHLKHSIYGLKQASHTWNKTLD